MAGPVQVVNIASSPSSTQKKLPASSHRLPTVSASAALQELQSPGTNIVASELRPLDLLLDGGESSSEGGFERCKTTEIWGPSGAGKTALMLQTAASTLKRGQSVVWLDADTPLNGARLESIMCSHFSNSEDNGTAVQSIASGLKRFHHRTMLSLSHLLAFALHPRPDFPPENTALLIIDGVNSLVDLDYPRFPFASAAKTEQQKWQSRRRYAVLGSLVSGLNKLAVLNNIAVVVSTGCASRMRTDSGLGSALVPGVGGGEWDVGVWTRLVVFRDFGGHYVGLQKCRGRSLISREEIGEVGKFVCFDIAKDGSLQERSTGAGALQAKVATMTAVRSPLRSRKRAIDEVADSEDEEVDEYGWAEGDEGSLTEETEQENPS